MIKNCAHVTVLIPCGDFILVRAVKCDHIAAQTKSI